MTDLALGGMWVGVLGAGLAACVIAHALGLASTYVRDALHVGAGVWIAGWPWWHGAAVPIAIVATVAIATAALPVVAGRIRLAARIVRSVTDQSERWTGLVHYTVSYTALTAFGLVVDPLPAAAALLALSLGDGIGGLVGRALGAHHYRVPGGKRKSLEGSFAVWLAATAGVLIAARLVGHPIGAAVALGLGALAAVVEAVSPRGTDNLLVPAAVWAAATLVT